MRCSRQTSLVTMLAAIAGSLLVGACGGGHSPTNRAEAALAGPAAYAHCMRAHGVLRFPDPNSKGQFPPMTLRSLGMSKQATIPANDSCRHLLPGGGEPSPQTPQQRSIHLADALSFANCMRGRGLTRFPDPTAQGDLSVRMVEAYGIDVHSPAVLRDVYACLPATHGALTPAKVRQALANAGAS